MFGEYDGSASSRTEAFLEVCRRGGVQAEISSDIRRAIWEKFVLILIHRTRSQSAQVSLSIVSKCDLVRLHVSLAPHIVWK